jgi:hypothetical protein
MHADRSWSPRFLTLPERVLPVLMLVTVFATGILVGQTWRLAQRRSDQLPQRPTLHQRLDAIEQRLQAIEQRLTP